MPNASDLIRTVPGGITLAVLATPGAAMARIKGVHGDALKVSVCAAPEKGKANAEIEALLAEFFGLKRGQVAVIRGAASRHKRVQILGLALATAEARIRQVGDGETGRR